MSCIYAYPHFNTFVSKKKKTALTAFNKAIRVSSYTGCPVLPSVWWMRTKTPNTTMKIPLVFIVAVKG